MLKRSICIDRREILVSNKIGRNEQCPCGSGLKYKKCCIDKSQDQLFKEMMDRSQYSLKKRAIIKHCLHPDKEHCSNNIIKAHAIQNNKILKSISDNGHVVTVDETKNFVFQDIGVKGRKLATTFSGFCGYHDKITFQEIEDKPFIGTSKQVFLLTYRTLAWHCQKKLEQNRRDKLIAEEFERSRRLFREDALQEMTQARTEFSQALQQGASDNNAEKAIFDRALLDENYEILNSVVWKLPYEVEFAVSMMNELYFDLKGNPINELELKSQWKSIYLNIFPYDGKTFVIWSWRKALDQWYGEMVSQFMSLGEFERKNYLNAVLPIWSDSLIISPRLWRSWGEEVQNGFKFYANMSLLPDMEKATEVADGEILNKPKPWDLFVPKAG
jgi:hypothetical protein